MSNAIDVAVLTGQAFKMLKKWIFQVALGSSFALPSLASEFPSRWSFVTLRTEHFDIIVNAEQQELGRIYARKLEKARSLLSAQFTDVPGRVPVVLADKTDLTNGYATRLPYSHIFLYPVLPGPQDSLGEPGDWALELAAHEYTHLLTFEAVSGAARPLQSVFGTILSPNLLLPRWWKEGVAVQVESSVASGGRLKSVYQDAVIRAFEQDQVLGDFDLAQINEVLPDWPQGLRPYLFGSLFWSEAVAERGPKVIDDLHQRHGGRVPYFVEAPAYDLLGSNYEAFYEKALAETGRRARAQLSALARVAITKSTELHLQARSSQDPHVSPDGQRLVVLAVDATGRRSLRVLERGPSGTFVDGVESESFVNRREEDVQPASKDAPPTGSISRVAWFPDGHRIVFDKVDATSARETWSDLWMFNAISRQSERLTKALRAREPSPSRDGRGVWFTGLEGGRTWLGFFDMETKRAKRLWMSGWMERIAFPNELPDGRVIFSLRRDGGQEGLYVINREGGTPTPVLAEYPNARYAEAVDDGVLFTSSRNGVHNLYLADATLSRARPLTHSATAVMTSARDARTGDLYATILTSKGPFVRHIARAELDRLQGATLPAVKPLFADRYPEHAPTVEPEPTIETRDYEPSSYLLPRYWFPMFGLSAVNNSLILQASTSGYDPLKRHVYSLSGSWDSGLGRGSYAASYQNGVFDHSFLLSAERVASYLVTPDNPITTDTGTVAVIPDIFRLGRHLAASVGWTWLRTDSEDSVAERTGPAIAVQYADFGRGGEQISPEDGGSLFVSAADYLPGSNRLEYEQYLASGSFFFSKWLPARHALAFRASAAFVPQTIAAIYGVQSTNYFFTPDPTVPLFVARGYRVGHFFGKSMGNANVEYRFPLREMRRGRGTDPIFINRLHGAVFADVIAVDGGAYRPESQSFASVRTNRVFSSAGAEARLETTIGYFLPLNLIAGYVVPSSREFSDGPGFLLSLQMGTLF